MSNPTRTRQASPSGGENTKRGGMAAAFKKEEDQVQKKRSGAFMPFRMWLKRGEEVAITFLDDSLEGGFYRHEHNIKVSEKEWSQEPCYAEFGPCKHCNAGSKESVVGFLSVLVHKPYTSKAGETREQSKMLYTFKRGQYEGLERVEKIAKKKYGTLRGVTIWLSRKDEENSFSTGEPVANEDGETIDDFYNEEDLIASFGHDPVTGRDGKILRPENDDIMVYPYRKLMPPPTAEEANGKPTAGSRAASEEEYDEGDEIPDVPSPRSRSRRRTQETDEGHEEDGGEGEDGGHESAPAPATSRRRSRPSPTPAPAPATRTRTRTRPTEGEPSFQD